jgi:hypothetical protein
LKPIALSCAHCHSSTVCSMPTSVGPIASVPKPPPPATEWAEPRPSPANDTDAVLDRPLASVTSSVTVSSALLKRGLRVYAISLPSAESSVVVEDDQSKL